MGVLLLLVYNELPQSILTATPPSYPPICWKIYSMWSLKLICNFKLYNKDESSWKLVQTQICSHKSSDKIFYCKNIQNRISKTGREYGNVAAVWFPSKRNPPPPGRDCKRNLKWLCVQIYQSLIHKGILETFIWLIILTEVSRFKSV